MANLKIIPKAIGTYLFGTKTPLSVSFLITPRCNLRCKYCNSYNQKDKEMTTEQIKNMINELAGIGVKRIGFTGGEPLLRKDIGESINHAKSKGIKTTLFSNGVLVPAMISKIKNIDLLLLSFDGPKHIQDKQRMKGSYDAVVKAIKAAKKAKIRIWTNTVITKDNIEHIDFVLKKVKELGVSAMFMPIFEYSITANKKIIESMSSELPLFRKNIRKLIEAKKAGYPIINSISYFKYVLKYWPQDHFSRCFAGKFFFAINSDGTVAPCHYLVKSGKWPSGLKMGFKKAIKKANLIKCTGCYGNAYIDSNLFFSFNPEAIYNAMKMYRF